VALLTFSWLYAFHNDEAALSARMELLHMEQENQAVAHLNLPPLISGKSASLSGGHITQERTMDEQYDLDASSVTAQLEFAPPGEHPKVALMFLVKGSIPTEPIWRQFLENAGKLTLKAKSFKLPSVNLKKKLKNGFHPSISGLEESRYPGYKIQHGMVPPSKYRSTDYPHVKRRLLEFENIQEMAEEEPITRSDSQAANLTSLPLDGWRNASNAGCKGEQDALQRRATFLLNDERYGHDIYQQQDFFSVYVHASPGFSFPPTSLFSGLEVKDPANLTNAFALHTLIMAEMKLLEAALKEERNQKFVLLSESCIPIHPPEVVYAQAIHESKSRINACLDMFDYGRLELWRWKVKMETQFLKKGHWRKSQQWYILNRDHAELALKDNHIKEVFKRYCWSYGKHICVSDEHYFPTLLASYGLDDETDCLGEGTWTNWTAFGWHPKTFEPEEISPTLLRITMNRGWPPCDPLSARRTALRLFDVDDAVEENVNCSKKCMDERLEVMTKEWASEQADAMPDDWTMKGGYVPLGYECPIFARKFPADAIPETLNATLSCSGAALGPWCLRWHQSLSDQ